MKRIFSRGFLYTISGLLLLAVTVFISVSEVIAQPSCEWDCMTTECCGSERMCNGGTYGSMCPDACVGPGHYEPPLGTPCL
jgi:hypothetical protein